MTHPGTLRIVAGRLKGRKIPVPADPELRPTGDRVREALFNILGQDLTGFRVLDLYAGTGALGFEALSRGASGVVFVEASPRTAAAIRQSAETLGVALECRIFAGRVEQVLDRTKLGGPFEIVLADPPYREEAGAGIVEAIDAGRVLGLHGTLVVERESRSAAPEGTVGLKRFRTAKYGRTSLDFFKY
ncbi:MAG TPA: 16S rRNA (guanine(966)-N(2))-methyltransferase RsmD [Candidatus Polarisedimenticolaceae bacterium]|nr:16S rRNA (guanine(966)-N(2))-methyltransferase RsmD [Candidatus Polarisedimenticolaceae bacterium]